MRKINKYGLGEFVKRKETIILLVILFIAISGTILPNYLNDLDELWNFNFARNISEGRLPYKEFNIIITPLLPIITALFFTIFGVELIVMRILGVVLCTAVLFIIYRILKILQIHRYIIYLSMVMFYFLFLHQFRMDYNFAILLVVLIALYYEINKVKNGKEILEYNFKFDFCLGILIRIKYPTKTYNRTIYFCYIYTT
jgi:4-amino-4-deoxy-L-arabinose transferase-like glycosyltransferase